MIMDVGSHNAYPSCSLSNFAAHEFVIDGVRCASMEGFLQSLKFSNPEMQEHVCSLIGIAAKRAGKGKNWQKKQTLYWRGEKIGRRSKEYQELLDRAYMALFQNPGFRAALRAAGNATFTHSVGKRKEGETVLTIQEFCHRLNWLRDMLPSVEDESIKTVKELW